MQIYARIVLAKWMNISRLINHNNMIWVIQQFWEAAGFSVQPRYIIRDNDNTFGSGIP